MEEEGVENPMNPILIRSRHSAGKIFSIINLSILFLVFCFSSPSFANDFDEGLDAIHETDYEKALEILMPLAVKGHAPSQYNLGVMHEWGNGVPKDYVKAMKWYKLSAQGSHKDAQNNLGAMYSKGEGTEQNFVDALKWFVISAENGSEAGRKNIDIVEKRMTPEQITQARKLAREWTRRHRNNGF
ncbi:MAG: sel1 repeat family protein [Nitrospinae bacterium]|nr:sel1 repeat family protein [Nitrospinota bacterium]